MKIIMQDIRYEKNILAIKKLKLNPKSITQCSPSGLQILSTEVKNPPGGSPTKNASYKIDIKKIRNTKNFHLLGFKNSLVFSLFIIRVDHLFLNKYIRAIFFRKNNTSVVSGVPRCLSPIFQLQFLLFLFFYKIYLSKVPIHRDDMYL